MADREKGHVGYDVLTDGTYTGEGADSAVWKATENGVAVGDIDKNITRQITSVAAGTNDTDAVNVSQLNQVKNDQQNIYNKIDRLDDEIDRVGTGAAALAALHPLDFDADEKLDFSTGVGHYRGQNAVAVGAFYRPSEDTMISVAGTVGNGSPMMNVGFSWKFGQHNHVSKNTVAMAVEQ